MVPAIVIRIQIRASVAISAAVYTVAAKIDVRRVVELRMSETYPRVYESYKTSSAESAEIGVTFYTIPPIINIVVGVGVWGGSEPVYLGSTVSTSSRSARSDTAASGISTSIPLMSQ